MADDRTADTVVAKVPVTVLRADGQRDRAHLLRLRDGQTGEVSTVLPFGYVRDPSISHEVYEALEAVAHEMNNARAPVRSGSGVIHPAGSDARGVRFNWSAGRPEPCEPESGMHPDADGLFAPPLRGP